MESRNPKTSHPEPLGREDLETLYWALIDMLTSGIVQDEGRRVRLKLLVARLSEQVRSFDNRTRRHSGIRHKAEGEAVRSTVRGKLLRMRDPSEVSHWAIYAEGVEDSGKAILIDVFDGKYAEAVERALVQPDFITEGMGGQIEPLGTEDSV